jgi:uncharacterized cupredoxin-like copper-binding protein
MRKIFVLVCFGLLAGMFLTACGPKKTTLNIEMKEYTFTPSTLEVPAGGEVTVNLKNTGTLEHEMVIMVLGTQATVPFDADDEGNVFWEAEVEMGQSASITFTAPTEPGEYQIVCGIPAHLELGMTGTLIVK